MSEIEAFCTCVEDAFSDVPEPLFRIICHCKTCQVFYGRPYNDECTFWLKDCGDLDFQKVEFKSYQSTLSPLKRGKCKACGRVVYSIAKIGFLDYLIMVPAETLKINSIPAPRAHIYYDRRLADVNDTVKKVSGHISSQVLIQSAILRAAVKKAFT